MKLELESLRVELATAHSEIDKFMLEIISLKELNKKYEQVIENLKKVCTTTTLPTKVQHLSAKKKKRISSNKIDITPMRDTKKSLQGNESFTESENDEQAIKTSCTRKEEIEIEKKVEDMQQKKKKPTHTDVTPLKALKEERVKQIHIIGGQQCVGLAERLIDMRSNTRYEKLKVSSVTKPNAKTEEILGPGSTRNISKDDWVILSVGEHDSNPIKTLIELSSALKKLTECDVIVLGIQNSDHLQVSKLNYELKCICNQFKNCTFLTPNSFHEHETENRLRHLCSKINTIIDSQFYERTFLNFEFIRKFNQSKVIPPPKKTNTNLKRGTIPYYFQTKQTETKKKIPQMPNSFDKGTIPYYFKKTGEIFNKSNEENLQNNFFRP